MSVISRKLWLCRRELSPHATVTNGFGANWHKTVIKYKQTWRLEQGCVATWDVSLHSEKLTESGGCWTVETVPLVRATRSYHVVKSRVENVEPSADVALKLQETHDRRTWTAWDFRRSDGRLQSTSLARQTRMSRSWKSWNRAEGTFHFPAKNRAESHGERFCAFLVENEQRSLKMHHESIHRIIHHWHNLHVCETSTSHRKHDENDRKMLQIEHKLITSNWCTTQVICVDVYILTTFHVSQMSPACLDYSGNSPRWNADFHNVRWLFK